MMVLGWQKMTVVQKSVGSNGDAVLEKNWTCVPLPAISTLRLPAEILTDVLMRKYG